MMELNGRAAAAFAGSPLTPHRQEMREIVDTATHYVREHREDRKLDAA